jgi:hypothetical protein
LARASKYRPSERNTMMIAATSKYRKPPVASATTE